MALSVPAIFSPYVRLELLKWDPLHEDVDFFDMKWYSINNLSANLKVLFFPLFKKDSLLWLGST
jgi:hypothetical protein